MAASSNQFRALIDKLDRLPPERVTEVEDFVEFLTAREQRAAAAKHLGEALGKLDSLNLPPVSDKEIQDEIDAVRREQRSKQNP